MDEEPSGPLRQPPFAAILESNEESDECEQDADQRKKGREVVHNQAAYQTSRSPSSVKSGSTATISGSLAAISLA